MISDELAIKLHHRAVLHDNLSKEEAAQLQEWRDHKDDEEGRMLGLSQESLDEARTVIYLRQMISLIAELVRQNDVIAKQNDALLSEIAELRHQLAARASA